MGSKMCGIACVVGAPDAPQLVLSGLRALEYRGYDSWGIAEAGGQRHREVGKISAGTLPDGFPKSAVAIGHTRWATHGAVTAANAHPHASADGQLFLVQNGVVENDAPLRARLQKAGTAFHSETDTELIVHLLVEQLNKTPDLPHAAAKVAAQLAGRSAFVVMQGETMVGVRRGSPLIVGLGEDGQTFLASDTPAFSGHTRRVMYLDEDEVVCLSPGRPPAFFRPSGSGELVAVEKRCITLEDLEEENADEEEAASEESHEHHMSREIFQQKRTISRAVSQPEADLERAAAALRTARGVFFVGCGTAHKVASAGEYFFADVAGKHVNAVESSEFPLFASFLRPESLIVAISQSGETADVLEAVEAAKKAGSRVLALVNTPHSTLAREADVSLLLRAGPERAVASTKASTSQLALLLLLAHEVSGKRERGRALLAETAANINDLLNPRFAQFVQSVAKDIASSGNEHLFILGRGPHFPIAREAAIKIQEVSYLHAEGFASGEMKHGPIAMIEPGSTCLMLGDSDAAVEEKNHTTAAELATRGARIIGISPTSCPAFHTHIRVPAGAAAQPLLSLIPVQMLAYFLARERGLDPDLPRNLAKSVTVA